MSDASFGRNQGCLNDLHMQQIQLCYCKKCERAQKFQQLLNHLTAASKKIDYEEQITTIVTAICAVCAQFDFYRIHSLF